MDFSQINQEFIFNAIPPVATKLYLPLSIFFGLLLICGFGTLFMKKRDYGTIWRRYTTPLLLSGTLGFIHLGARYEQLPWLASRFFLILVITVLFAWLLSLAMTMTRLIPEQKKESAVAERYNKYLPKKKK